VLSSIVINLRGEAGNYNKIRYIAVNAEYFPRACAENGRFCFRKWFNEGTFVGLRSLSKRCPQECFYHTCLI
jgi:hypothetical protein